MQKSAMSLIFIAILLGGIILSVVLVAEPIPESKPEKVPVPVSVAPPKPNKDFAKAKGGTLFCGVVVVGIPINIEEN